MVVTSGSMEQEKAVESHVSPVLRKLHLSNRHQLARRAEQRRLVQRGEADK